MSSYFLAAGAGEEFFYLEPTAHQIMEINCLLDEVVTEWSAAFDDSLLWYCGRPPNHLMKLWNRVLFEPNSLNSLLRLLDFKSLSPHIVNILYQVFNGGPPINKFPEVKLALREFTDIEPVWTPYAFMSNTHDVRISQVRKDGVDLFDRQALLDYLQGKEE